MPYRYVPVVRTKAGEADALGNLSSTARAKIFPLIRMTDSIPISFASKLAANAPGTPISLDGTYNHSITGTAAPYIALFNQLGSLGFPIIPVIPLHGDPVYITAATSLVDSFGQGFILHISLAELQYLPTFLANNPNRDPNSIDLLIDAGGMSEHNPTHMANYVAHTINATISQNHPWRSVSLYSWSAPKDVGQLTPGRNDIQRRDWQTWTRTYQNVNFQLGYSDSGHVHPSLENVPGYAMANATVSVRYALDDIWIIHKGVPTTGPNGLDMGIQYRNHANTLINDPSFGGLLGCWGDSRIQHYAHTTGGTGGRGQWAAILLNRHLSLTADRLP